MIKLRDLPINPPLGVMLRCPICRAESTANQRDYMHCDPEEDLSVCYHCYDTSKPDAHCELVQRVTTYRKWTTPKRFKRPT